MTYPEQDQVYSLAAIGLSNDDICAITQLDSDELDLHYAESLALGRANMRKNILNTQIEIAIEERDKTMLIHLGKALCGQSEKYEHEHKGEVINVVSYGDEPLKPFVPSEPAPLQRHSKPIDKGFEQLKDDNKIIGGQAWEPEK